MARGKVTSPKVAKLAAKALSNRHTSKTGKSIAGSALVQHPAGKTKKK